MKIASLNAKVREGRGSRQAVRLRAQGFVPAVLYGRGGANRALALPEHEFTHHVVHHHKLFELELDDGTQEEAFLQALQWDEIEDRIIHADLLRVDLSTPMHTKVPVTFVGHPKGLAHDGIFDAPHPEIEIECLPRDVPEEIKLVINELDVGEAIHARELELPPGVKLLTDPDAVVCHCRRRGGRAEETAGEAEAAPSESGASGEGEDAQTEGPRDEGGGDGA